MSEPIPLSKLKTKQGVRVTEIRRDPQGHWRKLIALGITPHTRLQLLQRYPTFVVQVGHTQAALDTQMAELVMVEKVEE